MQHQIEIQTKTGYGYNINLLIKMALVLYFDKQLKRKHRYFFTFNEWIILHNLKKTYHENNKITFDRSPIFRRMHRL